MTRLFCMHIVLFFANFSQHKGYVYPRYCHVGQCENMVTKYILRGHERDTNQYDARGIHDEKLSSNYENLQALAKELRPNTPMPRVSDDTEEQEEAMFSLSYDPLEPPSQLSLERDLEDLLMERALRFYDEKLVTQSENCYLVGLEDKSIPSDGSSFTMEESLTELSELAGAAGLTVIGSTYQRVSKPSIEYYIGLGKTKDIAKAMGKNKCTCVIFDTELTPSQQKNLELAFNSENKDKSRGGIKVVDRTALILDIFAQHARTKEGQLQVQLALLTYRLPRLTNMWSHLERQSAGARGRSNGGVGLRGPGEKQLESDKRQMRSKISLLNRAIDSVRRHRSQHRSRRKRLGIPVIALVGYTNAGKSTLLNSLSQNANVFVADMLFATLDPTTRRVSFPGAAASQHSCPDILLTDTVGFIQKLPTNLVAAFRATLEEIAEADVLLHVTDISNTAWRKQEAAVLRELTDMGLDDKPIVTLWNKVDLVPERKEFLKFEAKKRGQTVAVSAATGEGMDQLMSVLETALSAQMETCSLTVPYGEQGEALLSTIHDLGVLDEVVYGDDGVFVRGRIPAFLNEQIEAFFVRGEVDTSGEQSVNWKALAKGRHRAVRKYGEHVEFALSSLEDDEEGLEQQDSRVQEWSVSSDRTGQRRATISTASAVSDASDDLLLQGLDSTGLLDFDSGDYGYQTIV